MESKISSAFATVFDGKANAFALLAGRSQFGPKTYDTARQFADNLRTTPRVCIIVWEDERTGAINKTKNGWRYSFDGLHFENVDYKGDKYCQLEFARMMRSEE